MHTEQQLKSHLAKNLSKWRDRRGLTQAEFAEKLNEFAQLSITRSNVAAYETTAAAPKLETLYAIARFFEVSIDALLSNTEESINEQVIDQKEMERRKNQYEDVAAGYQFYKVLCARFLKIGQEIDAEISKQAFKGSMMDRMRIVHRDMFLHNDHNFKAALKDILTTEEWKMYYEVREGESIETIVKKTGIEPGKIFATQTSAYEKVRKYIDELPL